MSFDSRRPHNPRRRSFVSILVEHNKIAYYQYEVTFPLYVMSPGEKLAFNSFMLMFLSLLIFTTVTYLPPLVLTASRKLLWLGKSAENQLLLLT
jgi:Small subunit of serine palmitoyltransferase-like